MAKGWIYGHWPRRRSRRSRARYDIIWPRRKRHSWDKGDPCQRLAASMFRWMTDGRAWRRHPEPFSKTERGRRRRCERRFALRAKEILEDGVVSPCA